MKETAKQWQKLPPSQFPRLLQEITDPPKILYREGRWPEEKHFLTVVGSRHHSQYGTRACQSLIRGLRGHPIVIVSGLAWGIDTVAHQSALEVGLTTIAVPGSGLDRRVIYPRENVRLAEKILEAGGALISEYEPETRAARWTFPRRNRIMAGLSEATLVIEAQSKSGTLITARLAMEYNREVLAVPGPIDSLTSTGTNQLIADGARPILTSADILEQFNIKTPTIPPTQTKEAFSKTEKLILDTLTQPRTKDEIALSANLSIRDVLITLSSLEMRGIIKEQGGQVFRLF